MLIWRKINYIVDLQDGSSNNMISSEKDHLDKILAFLSEIGIDLLLESLPDQTFLPGLAMRSGVLVVDVERLAYVGDVLHEAGHLACMPSEIRANMSDTLANTDINNGGEMMAMAWSFAACKHLELEPNIVFHEAGYKGAASNLIAMFENGGGLGVPLLQWNNMCYDIPNAERNNQKPFPHMLKWTCDENKYITI